MVVAATVPGAGARCGAGDGDEPGGVGGGATATFAKAPQTMRRPATNRITTPVRLTSFVCAAVSEFVRETLPAGEVRTLESVTSFVVGWPQVPR